MSKIVLKKNATHAAVKLGNTSVAPGSVTETITLNTDLLDATREALTSGGTPTVNITNIQWTGVNGATFTISRNGTVIFYGDVLGSSPMNFNDFGYIDSESNTTNIVVTIVGQAQVYLGLRKTTGYSVKFEPEQYGALDNPAVVGS